MTPKTRPARQARWMYHRWRAESDHDHYLGGDHDIHGDNDGHEYNGQMDSGGI